VTEPHEPTEPTTNRGLSRRRFIQIAGVGAAVGAVDPFRGGVPAWSSILPIQPSPTGIPQPDITFRLLRRDDMVWLTFRGYNLRIVDQTLVPLDAARPSVLVVELPPQALLEQAIPFGSAIPAVGMVRARLTRPSRLAFALPQPTAAIPLTADALLDFARWPLNLSIGARPAFGALGGGFEDPVPFAPVFPNGGPLAPFFPKGPPKVDETAIEAPWRVILSPNRRGRFLAATRPTGRVLNGRWNRSDPFDGFEPDPRVRHEVWHTRLVTEELALPPVIPVDPITGGIDPVEGSPTGELVESPDPNRIVRAVWALDPDMADRLYDTSLAGNTNDTPFIASMRSDDRTDLVRRTTDYRLDPEHRTPVRVNTLMLSTLGAALDVEGTWPELDDSSINLLSWRHLSNLGRDAYVRVVRRGFLLPFGHRASQIVITEREFRNNGAETVAVLIRRTYVSVRERRLRFPEQRHPFDARLLPFSSVEIRTRTSPEINEVGFVGGSVTSNEAFFMTLAGTNPAVEMLWDVVATDRRGRRVEMTMPMAFVLGSTAEDESKMSAIRNAWNAASLDDHPAGRGSVRLAGAEVAYAAPLASRPAGTTISTDRLRFRLDLPTGTPGSITGRRSRVSVTFADVRLPEVSALTANDLGSIRVRYDNAYRDGGFNGANAGGVVLALDSTTTAVRFSRDPGQESVPGAGADKAGGVISPDLILRGWSRASGPVIGDLAAYRSGSLNPNTIFGAGGVSPKMLGGIPLSSVIAAASIAANQAAGSDTLRITTSQESTGTVTSLRWRPGLRQDPLKVFTPSPGSRLELDAVIRTPLDGGPPSQRVDGRLDDFTLTIPSGVSPATSLFIFEVRSFRFRSVDGARPDVDVDIERVGFGGPLAFIERLASYIGFGGGGPAITALPDRVEASLALALPSIELGVFALRNIQFGIAIELPFSGEPARIRFQFSTRSDPFRLTVFMITGSGYVELGMGADGIDHFAIGLSAGMELAVDFGVASGRITCEAGFHYSLRQTGDGDEAILLGYFSLRGSVQALGLISASIELRLELEYRVRTQGGKTIRSMYGRGTIIIDISVPLAPTPSVKIEIEKAFKADRADPTFRDQLPAAGLWADYCAAFAPTGGL
jgi:hypothetical protein